MTATVEHVRLAAAVLRQRHKEVVLPVETVAVDEFDAYRFDAANYIREKLGWQPWGGTPDEPGQLQVIQAYELALRQQYEKRDYEIGLLRESELRYWHPGQEIKRRIRLETGHSIGKTKLGSGLVNHFFDCFEGSIIYTFAPSWEQIHDLLWKEIKADRRGKGLPGRILDLQLHKSDDWFAKGRATNNDEGQGTERIQGQHAPHFMALIDEAEGVKKYVFDAVNAMTSGGIWIVFMFANPRTRSSEFHQAATRSETVTFHIDSLTHPNVREGRDLIPGAATRDWADSMIDDHCEVVEAENPDHHTFTVPWRPGLVFAPDAEFMFRVLGIAPLNVADNTLVPVGRYLAAKARLPESQLPAVARLGVDVARFGKDYGTLYVRHDGRAWRAARFAQVDTTVYAQAIKAELLRLHARGVQNAEVRVDGGGGFGGGVIDQLAADLEILELQRDYRHPFTLRIREVQFGGTPYDEIAYADLVTEMYDDAAEALKSLALTDVPDELEADLCERTYRWANRAGRAVKRLEPKDDRSATSFRRRLGRSPDDGDGFVLAVASDFIFEPRVPTRVIHEDRVHISRI